MIKEVAQELDIELDDKIAEGEYANLAIINHSTSEFVIDFARMMPGTPKATVKSRVILSPEHTKRLLMSLQDNVARYEAVIGRINLPTSADDSQIAMSFGQGEA